jgi:hypothetical protein
LHIAICNMQYAICNMQYAILWILDTESVLLIKLVHITDVSIHIFSRTINIECCRNGIS